MHILHVITNLELGGAETCLSRLLPALDRHGARSEVVSLMGLGTIGGWLQQAGYPVRALGLRRGSINLPAILRLARWIRQCRPDVIHAWMYHASLLSSLAAALGPRVPLVWAIHHSNLDPRLNGFSTLATSRACAALSRRVPGRIVFVSRSGLDLHCRSGYAADRSLVIPNGFDTGAFKPDPAAGAEMRHRLGIPGSAPVVGMVARFDPFKDHANFFAAAARVRCSVGNVRFLLCGDGVTLDNPAVARMVRDAGILRNCHLLGRFEAVPRLMAAMDLLCSSSAAEAFPAVLGEAMACGLPCVVTDVGDCAYLVGGAGAVVPPRNPDRLASALVQMIRGGPALRRRLGLLARCRVEQLFGLDRTAASYMAAYRDAIRSRRAPAGLPAPPIAAGSASPNRPA